MFRIGFLLLVVSLVGVGMSEELERPKGAGARLAGSHAERVAEVRQMMQDNDDDDDLTPQDMQSPPELLQTKGMKTGFDYLADSEAALSKALGPKWDARRLDADEKQAKHAFLHHLGNGRRAMGALMGLS